MQELVYCMKKISSMNLFFIRAKYSGIKVKDLNPILLQYQTACEKASYYEKQVESLQTAARSTSLLMKHGNTTYLEVLTAQQTLLSARLTQVSNRFMEIQGVINLYQALGGGRI